MILAVLVDAAPWTRDLARAVTELRTGVVCTSAPDLAGLAAHLRATVPDLVVVDLSLPDTRGPHDCLDAVRALWPGPLATLTGDASHDAASACVRCAADHWLKPMTPREFADAITARVSRHRSPAPARAHGGLVP